MKIQNSLGFALLIALFAGSAFAQNVRLTWIGQAGFIFQTDGGPTVVVDPPSPNIGYPIPNIPADVVTVSHNHGDHNYTAGVKGNFTLVDGCPVTSRAQMTAANIPFVLIPGFHDGQGGAVTGQNTIVQWTQSGRRFAHFGDFGQDSLTEAQLADRQNLDVVVLPAGGYFTQDLEQVSALATQLGARVTVLMHYRTALAGTATAASLPAVSSAFSQVTYKPSTLLMSKATLPAVRQILVMEPTADAVVVNSASFTPGAPMAPAGLATLLGNFTGSGTATASSLPLPNQLGQTQVMVNGAAVPLSYVSPTQINLQIPGALSPGQYLAQVMVGGQSVARTSVTVVTRSPGIFSAFNADGRLNTAITPARTGDLIQLYGTGQGPGSATSNIADGAASPANQALTRGLPAVMIGGVPATVRRSGLTSGLVGV